MKNDDIVKNDAKSLVDFLKASKDDKGIMADIRASASETLVFRAWPHLAQFGGISSSKTFAVRIVAYMFAMFPYDSSEAGNFGDTLKRIERVINQGKPNNEDTKKTPDIRLRYLLSADRSEIATRLRKICGFLKNVPNLNVNYEQLYCDLIYWSDKVKERWAESYYNFKG